MLRLSRVTSLTAAMLAASSALSTAMAAPPVECARKDAQTGICLVEASSPGQAVEGVAQGGETPGEEVPEASGGAAAPNPCTYTVAQPQPAPGSVIWQGKTAADGVVYVQVCPRGDGSGLAAVLV